MTAKKSQLAEITGWRVIPYLAGSRHYNAKDLTLLSGRIAAVSEAGRRKIPARCLYLERGYSSAARLRRNG